jgi:succinate-acetate transporter protein
LLSLVFLVCSVRTNIVLVLLFAAYSIAFPLLAAADWCRANNLGEVGKLETAAGACCFVVALCGWYALVACLFKSVDFPCALPMGDLSAVFKGAAERRKAKENAQGLV